MGHYTTIRTTPIILNKNLPDNVVKFITDCINHEWNDGDWKPNHKLFTLERWENIFFKGFDEAPYFKKKTNGYYELFIYNDIKFGHEECQSFLDWISIYVAGRKLKQYIGWHKGENYYDRRFNMYVYRSLYKIIDKDGLVMDGFVNGRPVNIDEAKRIAKNYNNDHYVLGPNKPYSIKLVEYRVTT